MRTTSPTRPPIRNGPATAASDIFGGPCLLLTACPSLPAPPSFQVGLCAHPKSSLSSPPHPLLVYTTAEPVVELVASRGLTAGKARQAKHSTLH